MLAALDRVDGWLAPLQDAWPTMPDEQRRAVLDNSPLLARLLGMTEVFRGN
jgi:hypothetical protein